MAGTTTYYGISYPTATDYVKDGATAMQTIADGFDSAVAIPTYNNQTGTTYTFVLADAGKTVTSNNASAVTFTIPPQTSVAWANNTTLIVRNLGAGVVTIAGGAGVTVTNTAQTVVQYGSIKIIRTASNAWTILPNGGSTEVSIANGNFTTQSAINLSSILSNTYKFYTLNFTCIGSATGTLTFRFRENTTDKSADYVTGSYSISSAGAAGNWLSSTAGTGINVGDSSTTIYNSLTCNIYRPNATTAVMNWQSFAANTSNAIYGSTRVSTMTNFNGLSLFPASGTITGSYLVTGRLN